MLLNPGRAVRWTSACCVCRPSGCASEGGTDQLSCAVMPRLSPALNYSLGPWCDIRQQPVTAVAWYMPGESRRRWWWEEGEDEEEEGAIRRIGGGAVCVTCCHLSGSAAASLEILGCCLRVLYHLDKCSLGAVHYQHAQGHETHSD